MNWLNYLLEANLYLTAFYIMYKLLLQRQTFYNSNRYFLIISVVVSFVIPLIQLGFLKPEVVLQISPVVYDMPTESLEVIPATVKTNSFTTTDYLFFGYVTIVVALSINFLLSIAKIMKLYFKGKRTKLDGYTLVEINTAHTAFSFFNTIFIHPKMAKNNVILKHEMIHIKQGHSWDIILLALLKICSWFNPIVYFLKKDLTLLQEYIADSETTSSDITKHDYAMFLIESSMSSYSPQLVNQFFNQTILKNRIIMLNKEKTANWARLKYLLAIPLGLGSLCVSTLSFSKSYGYEIFPGKEKTAMKEIHVSKNQKLAFYPFLGTDENTGKKYLNEKQYILINGVPVEDMTKFYGVYDADEIKYYNLKDAYSKFGKKGKDGAIEITGTEIKKFNKITIRPYVSPPLPKGQTHFPKRIINTYFYPMRSVDKNGNINSLDKRYIVVNDKPIDDVSTFYGVTHSTKITYLDGKDAIKKYGTKANFGAVEITGKNLKFVKSIADVPPPPRMEQAKFRPPIVKPDTLKRRKIKRDQVKFPPTYKPKNQTSFYPQNRYQNQKITQIENRLIVINGLKVEDNSKFYGVTNSNEILVLNPTEAVKKYGAQAKYGAVEITGNVKGTGLVELPPSLYGKINIDRPKGEKLSFSKISETKALTIYDKLGNIVYNNSSYNDDWNVDMGNYKKFENKKITAGVYTYFLKINEAPEKSERGILTIK